MGHFCRHLTSRESPRSANNALQSGENPGAVMNEVAAVTRRLIEGLLSEPDNCPVQIAKAFAHNLISKRDHGHVSSAIVDWRLFGPRAIGFTNF
jgi:hypothetical protein